jgi:hypothetical protein
MEAMINKYAGLRVPICLGTASSADISRIKIREDFLLKIAFILES